MTEARLLIGDIGGTNARFALANVDGNAYSALRILPCAQFATAEDALVHYLREVGADSPDAICLAAAGPVVEQRVRFTNNPWQLNAADLREKFSIKRVRLLNDFEAIAFGVPSLGPADSVAIGASAPISFAGEQLMFGVLGPGTGLGAVGLRKQGQRFFPIAGEAAHAGFAPETALQLEVLASLRERFDRVSTERLVSGAGLENIYWALSHLRGEPGGPLSAEAIFDADHNKADDTASAAVDLFCEILGQFAGDLALTLGAMDGIYIAGGIAQRHRDRLINSGFRRSFESKGRYSEIMARIPTRLIVHDQPGLLGAARCVYRLGEQ
ncbi:MAG: glucokinase [Woeseia sp.]